MVKAWIPFVVTIAGGLFSAQSAAQTAQPQYYVWDANVGGYCASEPAGWVHDPQFQLAAMIRVGADADPQCGFFVNPRDAAKGRLL